MDRHPIVVIADYDLIDAVLAGDKQAFAQIVDKYKRLAYNVAWQVSKNHEEAQEIAQDAFVKAYKNLGKFDRRSKFSTWFYRIVTNEALSRARKKKYDHTDIEAANHIGKSDDTGTENSRLVALGLSQLNEKDAELLTLFYLKELSLEEISEMLEIATNTLKVAVHRARQKLAKEMLALLGDEVYELVKN